MVVYDFYPTCCVFYIPPPKLGDRKDTTRWMKIIYNHKPWEVLYILLIVLKVRKLIPTKTMSSLSISKLFLNVHFMGMSSEGNFENVPTCSIIYKEVVIDVSIQC